MRTTIKDIAKAIGCSSSTVSRALNDHPQINENTKRAIRLMAKKMNFQINQVAAGLRKHKTNCLGVIVPNISHYFFSSTLSGIQQVASKSNYQVLICQTNDSMEEEAAYIKSLSAGRVDGILLTLSQSTDKYEHIKELKRNKMPLVLFDRTSDKVDAFNVVAQDEEGAFKGVEHLINSGCKKIAHLAGPKNLQNSVDRFNGYKKALKKNGIPFKSSLVKIDSFDENKVRESIIELFSQDQNIDAIFAVNDGMAVEAIMVLKSMSIKVPEEVSVIGFGDYPIGKIIDPSLTTVSHNAYEMGYAAAKRIMDEIDGKLITEEESVLEIGSELIIRSSTK